VLLAQRCEHLSKSVDEQWSFVFVFDGPDDRGQMALIDALQNTTFQFQIAQLHKNMGVSTAIRHGLGTYASDLYVFFGSDGQDPPDLINRLVRNVATNNAGVAIGVRTSRKDPFLHRIGATVFWRLQRRYVFSEVPRGGCDVVALNREDRDRLLARVDSEPNIISQILGLGTPVCFEEYERLERELGKSSWTLRRKVKYFIDNFFNYGSLPLRISLWGAASFALSTVMIIALQLVLDDHDQPLLRDLWIAVGFFSVLVCLLSTLTYARKIYNVVRDSDEFSFKIIESRSLPAAQEKGDREQA